MQQKDRKYVLEGAALDSLDSRLSEVVGQLLDGIRDAAMDVLAEADQAGKVAEGSSFDSALNGLMARVLSQDKATEFFRNGYIQGAADTLRIKPAYLSQIHSDCFDLGYEIGRLVRERREESRLEQEQTTAPNAAARETLCAVGVG